MNPIIRVEDLGKRYTVGRREAAYATVRESLARAAMSPVNRVRRAWSGSAADGRAPEPHLWALKGVSFEVRPGEIVGVIGRNGAGKSTLLKILSRVCEPTEGAIDLWGRVASLLEVGTGFHGELTGRENIFLNGAILGMRRAELRRKFDKIVDFAEVGAYIDTPVKRYSSGMYVRLAFAVAVHLDPEILVVDEVLAVGDAEFQKKCLGRIRDVSRGGRTILFVSHNMYTLRNICDRGILLERGRVVDQGGINGVVDRYLARTIVRDPQSDADRVATESFLVDGVRISSGRDDGAPIKTFDPVEVRVSIRARSDIVDPGLYVSILDSENRRLCGLDSKDFRTVPALRAGCRGELGFTIESLPLLPGDYQLEVWLTDPASHRFEQVPRTFAFSVAETPVYGGRKIDHWFGVVGLRAKVFQGDSQDEVVPPLFDDVAITSSTGSRHQRESHGPGREP